MASLVAPPKRVGQMAARLGLPAVGSRMINRHGIDWLVDGHLFVATTQTLDRWKTGETEIEENLYPSIIPQNLSPKLTEFIAAVDRCTSKHFLILDTMPGVKPGSVPHHHWIDTCANSGSNIIFLDASSVHETFLAHEIGHAWVQYVDLCEDERVFRNQTATERINQLNFIQSFVLDFKVNDVICAKGFDMSPIQDDESAAIVNLIDALAKGYVPPSAREEVFMAQVVAMALVNQRRRSNELAIVRSGMLTIAKLAPAMACLGERFAAAVLSHGFDTREGVIAAIDECLALGFHHTEDGIEIDKELFVPEVGDAPVDKYSTWLSGASLGFKQEVGRLMAREEIPSTSTWRISPTPDERVRIEFVLPDGSELGPWEMSQPYPWLCPSIARQIEEVNRMNRSKHPPPGPLSPNVVADQRQRGYAAGLGRFLTQARLEEQLRGEHPYAYAFANPTTFTDPSGEYPTCPIEPDPCDKYPHVPGFWDYPHVGAAIDRALRESKCAGFDPAYLRALLFCIIMYESLDKPKGYTWPTTGKGVQGPCQIWPGSDKDKLCGKNWRNSLQEHIRCCALILCTCLKGGGGNIIKGCGTTGEGADRTGQFQVINNSTDSFTPAFKCCLKRQGIKNPSQIIGRRKEP